MIFRNTVLVKLALRRVGNNELEHSKGIYLQIIFNQGRRTLQESSFLQDQHEEIHTHKKSCIRHMAEAASINILEDKILIKITVINWKVVHINQVKFNKD